MSKVSRFLALVALALVCLMAKSVNAEPVVVLVKVFPLPGREDELQTEYLKRVEYLRKAEPGTVFRLHRSTKMPTTFVWYEVYDSPAAYENHLKVIMPRYRKEVGPTPEGLIAKPSESETFLELAR
jgi:quinol monooxygenase YgiN